MNRLLRVLIGSAGDVLPSQNSFVCNGLNKSDWERLKHIFEHIKQNKENGKIANDGIDDKDVERFGKYIIHNHWPEQGLTIVKVK